MIHQAFITAMEVILAVGGVAYVAAQIKKGQISQTASISKQTEDGETVVFQTNFLSSESLDSKKKKLKELLDMGDDRRAFIYERYQAKLEEEKSKNLKAVN